MGIALSTKVVKENVNFEVLVQYFIIVFAYVFWRQLHLASTNIVPVLYERCVEHNSANRFVLDRPCTFKFNFYVSSQSEWLSLFVCQHKVARLILQLVMLALRKLKQLSDLHAGTFVDFEVRVTSTIWDIWNVLELNSSQTFYSWGMYLLFVISLKVVDIPQLARLWNPLSSCEPHVIVKL